MYTMILLLYCIETLYNYSSFAEGKKLGIDSYNYTTRITHLILILLVTAVVFVSGARNFPKIPRRPEECEKVLKHYTKGCLTRYECKRDSKSEDCPQRPRRPKGCEEVITHYKKGCLTRYECKNDFPLCAGATACPPAPSKDCTTSTFYKTIINVKCISNCKHYCCQTEAEVLKNCPETSPSNPYCIGTAIVRYKINGRECPVYCSCSPDCRRLTC